MRPGKAWLAAAGRKQHDGPLSIERRVATQLTAMLVRTTNSARSDDANHAKVWGEATSNPASRPGEQMARRRFQRGRLILRGKREKVWVGIWREDVIQADGSTDRIRK